MVRRRKPEIAHAVPAADRKRLIGQLEKTGDSLWLEYQQAGNGPRPPPDRRDSASIRCVRRRREPVFVVCRTGGKAW